MITIEYLKSLLRSNLPNDIVNEGIELMNECIEDGDNIDGIECIITGFINHELENISMSNS